MCTAISTNGFFGRTLDIERSYNEQIVIIPRKFCVEFLYEGVSQVHPAIIGVATVADGIPLYYDAVNEHGLAAAGLNFPISAVYKNKKAEGKYNVASYELIPFVLTNCRTVCEAKDLLKNTIITANSFSQKLKATPLHWMIADSECSITVEPTENGLEIYNNELGVLTNEPPFLYHATHVCEFLQFGAHNPCNSLCPAKKLAPYSRGMGAMGLPGDYSSSSRFIRALFAKEHTEAYKNEVERFFHVMDTVTVPYGCVKTDAGDNSFTLYTSCADLKAKNYYYTTYDCRHIRTVKLDASRANGNQVVCVPMHEAKV